MALARRDVYDLSSWPPDRLARLRAFIDVRGPEECWSWTGGHGQKGHALYRYREAGRMLAVYVHRIAWEFHHGPVPPGFEVFHRCLDVGCCNPAHLAAGPPAARGKALVARGRSMPGTRHPQAKLKPADVRRLVEAAEASPGATGRQLAALVGCSPTHANAIVRGATWKCATVARGLRKPRGPRLTRRDLQSLLRRHLGNVAAAAREVGMSRFGLVYRLEQAGLRPDRSHTR